MAKRSTMVKRARGRERGREGESESETESGANPPGGFYRKRPPHQPSCRERRWLPCHPVISRYQPRNCPETSTGLSDDAELLRAFVPRITRSQATIRARARPPIPVGSMTLRRRRRRRRVRTSQEYRFFSHREAKYFEGKPRLQHSPSALIRR